MSGLDAADDATGRRSARLLDLLRRGSSTPLADRAVSASEWVRLFWEHRLLTVLDLLDQRGLLAALPGDARALLQAAVRIDDGRARHATDVQLCGQLGALGLEFMVLKGAALACTVYPRPEQRFRYDLDLLVRPDQRLQAEALLQQLGYRRLPAPGNPQAIQSGWGRRCADIDHCVDLHWGLSNHPAFQGLLEAGPLLARAKPLAGLGAALGPDPVDALLHAVIHRYGHHRLQQHPAQWLLDVDLLWRSLDAQDRERAIVDARKLGLATLLAHTLGEAQDAFATPVDAGIIDSLSAAGAGEWRALFAAGQRDEWREFRMLLAATPGWRARLQVLRFRLFPPAHWEQAAGAKPRPAEWVARWLRIARRLLLGRRGG